MKVFVVNCGSSSIKFQLIEMRQKSQIATGMVERIGEEESEIVYSSVNCPGEIRVEKKVANHEDAMREIANLLADPSVGVIANVSELYAIGHRVVHGGESFQKPALINSEVIRAIKDNSHLAPLHNPVNLVGIEACENLFKDISQVAVFDTAFHQSMPGVAFHYALPYKLYSDHKIRRYGFHGTSHFYISKLCAAFLKKELGEINLISIHLGNGCSITAVKNGRSIDTSMGMTPLEGLIMGTRSGDLDPAIHFFLADHLGMDAESIEGIFNKESGLKGICGDNDVRDILKLREQNDKRATLAISMYTYRIKKYIGAYMAVLGKVDAIVFTAGVGENSHVIRSLSLHGLEHYGLRIDPGLNENIGDLKEKKVCEISERGSEIKILVGHTNEEMEIALQAVELLTEDK